MVPLPLAVYCEFYNTHTQVGGEFQYTQEANCTWHYQPCLCPASPQSVPDNVEGLGGGEMGGGRPAALGPLTGGMGSQMAGSLTGPPGGLRLGEEGLPARALRSGHSLRAPLRLLQLLPG